MIDILLGQYSVQVLWFNEVLIIFFQYIKNNVH